MGDLGRVPGEVSREKKGYFVIVAVGSAFRNARHYLPRYFAQVAQLAEHLYPSCSVRVIAAEGDSVDGTRECLRGVGAEVVACDHGQPWFGSTEAPERFAALSRVGNAVFGAVRESDDVLVYVESDLVWTASTVKALVNMALSRRDGFDVFAPLIFAGANFYDVWAFRKNGARFGPFPPYHPEVNGQLTEVDSAGSCLVMRAEVARRCRIRNNYCLVGWCEDARVNGYRIAVDPLLRVEHPC